MAGAEIQALGSLGPSWAERGCGQEVSVAPQAELSAGGRAQLGAELILHSEVAALLCPVPWCQAGCGAVGRGLCVSRGEKRRLQEGAEG